MILLFWLKLISLRKLDSCDGCVDVPALIICALLSAAGFIALDLMSFSMMLLVKLLTLISLKRDCWILNMVRATSLCKSAWHDAMFNPIALENSRVSKILLIKMFSLIFYLKIIASNARESKLAIWLTTSSIGEHNSSHTFELSISEQIMILSPDSPKPARPARPTICQCHQKLN